jgi:2-C-methyl-D-erythritol 4-phosphate cytidylyltransferase
VLYAIIPAAGIGSRMQSTIPKQYLPLLNGNVLLYSIRALLALPEIRVLMIALHPDDCWWPQTEVMLQPQERLRIQTCTGGAQRWQSVQAALAALSGHAIHTTDSRATEDWVLVHDAVRPCVRSEDLRALLATCVSDKSQGITLQKDGALLATPVTDTLKKADSLLRVESTVDRSQLWAACTPQMFPVSALQQALSTAEQAGISITDEASAMECAGARPVLVPCSKDNIKITYPADLELAGWILASRAGNQYSHQKEN